MSLRLRFFVATALLGALTAVACATADAPSKGDGTTTTTSTTASTTTTTTTTTIIGTPATPATPAGSPGAFSLQILVSTDEHGWLSPAKDKQAGVLRGGMNAAAFAMQGEGYRKGGPGWLLVSAGDMWTGPYETTVLEGAPMVAAMNHLGYRAAAVGNHEFDFGQRALVERSRGAAFPFLGANLVKTGTTELPAWAKPYVVVDVPVVDGGVARVAVVGLACVESPVTADVRNMVGLSFLPYAETLERWLPEVRAREKPDAIVVIAHDSVRAVKPLAGLLRQHGVHFIAAGHEHRAGITVDDNGTDGAADDVVICNAGPYLRSLCRVDLSHRGGALVAHEQRIVEVKTAIDAPAPAFDVELDRILQEAEASATRIGGEVLVQSTRRLSRGAEGALGQLLVDAWLAALPYAQVAITNAGGVRQDLDAGPLRIRDIVSALPFNNYLLVVDVTGAELRELLSNPETVVGGVTYRFTEEPGGTRVVTEVKDARGVVIADDQSFKVIINDFMYRGGDRYRFNDKEPEETAVDWREPMFRLLRSLHGQGRTLDRSFEARATRN